MTDSWMYSPDGPSSPDARAVQANFSAFRDSTSIQENPKPTGPPRIRRRNRIITSCLECRRRKLKCDKSAPCTNCTRFSRDCLYLAPAMDASSQQKLAEIKERMGALEKNLEREVAGHTGKPHPGGANIIQQAAPEAKVEDEVEDEIPSDEDGVALEPTPLAAMDAGYEDNGDDELMDLGVQMGKMRITDRIGGWVRPKLMDELNDTLRDVKAGKSRWGTSPLQQDHRDSAAETGSSKVKLQASPKSYIGPGPDYIAPASSFFFPGANVNTSLLNYLPSKNAADQLISQYWQAVNQVAKIVHRPTMEAQYTLFWNKINAGSEPLPSLQAIIFAAMFSAAVSLTNEQALGRFGTSKAALIDSLRSGTEMALSKANFLRTTKVDTMQAFIMYLIPLVRAEVSRAHSALVGTAIRLAECMGLHRDGSHYSMTQIEVHVRRMMWHQLCFLDQRTCEATGPRPQIRKDDYDTRFPLNVNDEDLVNATGPLEDKPYWTDNTLFRIRTECVEVRRQVWFDVVALDKKKKTLTSILVRIQKFRQSLESRYFPMINNNEPLHVFGRHVMALGYNGMIIQVLHRYLFSTTTRMPDRLRQVLIESGLAQMENAILLETNTRLATWSWYKGAFNQYHSALLLMVEVYAYPMRKDAARIWKCLDYIFDIPPHLAPKQKAELVITDLRDRMEIFHQMRRVRSTTQLEARVSSMASKSSMREAQERQQQMQTQPLVDSLGRMSQPVAINAPVPPVNFSPPPAQPRMPNEGSAASDSRHGSINAGETRIMGDMLMEDIDWNEWDKYFPVETNTGDLNIPDFNITDFTGSGYGNLNMDAFGQGLGSGGGGSSSSGTNNYGGTGGAASSGAAAQDLSDVNFYSATTFIPDPHYMRMNRQ